jgi:rod shape-determining protein MreC
MAARRRFLDYVIAVVLLICAFLLFLANAKSADSRNGLDRVVLRVSSPLEAAVSWVVGGAGDLVNGYVWLRDIDSENAELRAENERLRLENAALRQRQIDVAELSSLLEMKERLPSRALGARVIGGALTEHFRLARLSIDRGGDGVAPGMPVVTGDGLVGRIEEVASDYAEVLLITDLRSSVPVALPRSGGRGVLSGLGRSDRYVAEIEQLPRDIEIEVGDPVVTSGLGGKFPARLAVGTVSRVRSDPSSLYQKVEVAPAVDFSSFEAVMILQTVAPLAPDASSGEPAKKVAPVARRVRGK